MHCAATPPSFKLHTGIRNINPTISFETLTSQLPSSELYGTLALN